MYLDRSKQRNLTNISLRLIIYSKKFAEFIFGTIRSSGNYEQKGKTVGGKNGLGAKLANIYSKEFDIENTDKKTKTKYTQKFSENMYKKTEPDIQKLTGKILQKVF